MLIGILALQGDFDAHARTLARLGFTAEGAGGGARQWRLVRTAAGLEGLDGLILPGGESSTMLKFLARDGFFERLRTFAASHPAFGTCAGAILLARRVSHPEQAGLGALDAAITRNAYGRQRESSIRRAMVTPGYREALGAELETVLIRAPRFTALGPEVEVMAAVEGEPVLVRQGSTLAASFHPELSGEPRVHQWFVDRVAKAALK